MSDTSTVTDLVARATATIKRKEFARTVSAVVSQVARPSLRLRQRANALPRTPAAAGQGLAREPSSTAHAPMVRDPTGAILLG